MLALSIILFWSGVALYLINLHLTKNCRVKDLIFHGIFGALSAICLIIGGVLSWQEIKLLSCEPEYQEHVTKRDSFLIDTVLTKSKEGTDTTYVIKFKEEK